MFFFQKSGELSIMDIKKISDLYEEGVWVPGKRIAQLVCDTTEFCIEEFDGVKRTTVCLKDKSGQVSLILTKHIPMGIWSNFTYKFLMLKLSEDKDNKKLIVSDLIIIIITIITKILTKFFILV